MDSQIKTAQHHFSLTLFKLKRDKKSGWQKIKMKKDQA